MQRNFGLDAVRAFSIYLVLFQHFHLVSIESLGPQRIGVCGVEVFFVLSGLLIGGILFREIDKENSPWVTFKTFVTRRWLRILPLYYVAILLKFIISKAFIGWNILYYVFFLQNNFYKLDFFNVSWSLVIEEWFYLVAPALLILATVSFRTHRGKFYTILLLLVAVNVARIAFVFLKGQQATVSDMRYNVPLRFDSLFCGVLLAYFRHYERAVYTRLQKTWFFIAGMCVCIGYLLYVILTIRSEGDLDHDFAARTIGFLVFSLGIAAMLPFLETLPAPNRNNRAGRTIFTFITQTSLLTYAIYLCHPFILYGLLDKSSRMGNALWNIIAQIEGNMSVVAITYAIIQLAVVYVTAYLCYRIIEKPALNFRDRVKSQPSEALHR